VSHELEETRRELRAERTRAEKAEHALGNLLAIIHRDGGHHQGRVGDEQAVKDAHERWGRLMQLADRAETAERELAEIKGLHPLLADAFDKEPSLVPRVRALASCYDHARSTEEYAIGMHHGAKRAAEGLRAELAAAEREVEVLRDHAAGTLCIRCDALGNSIAELAERVRAYLRWHDANRGDDYFDTDGRAVRLPLDEALEKT
jgi:hypothetical protein